MCARYLAVKEETSYHAGGTPDVFMEWPDSNLEPDQGMLDVEGFQTREPRLFRPGSFKSEGAFSGYLDTKLTGYWLKWFCGTASVDGTVAPYTHTFIPTQNPEGLSFVAELGLEDITARRVAGMVVDTLTVEARARELVKVSVDAVGGSMELVSITTPTFGTVAPFAYHEGQLSIAGTAVAEVEAITLTLNNNIAEDDAYRITRTGGRFPKKMVRGDRSIELALDLSFDSTNYVKRFMDGATGTYPGNVYTPFEISFDFITNEAPAGTFSAILPRVIFNKDSIPVSGLDRLVEGLEAKAYYSAGSAYAISMSLVNGQASYG